MPYTFRKSFRFGPLRLNLNKNSVSVTAKIGMFSRTWSSNGSRRTSVDLPGPVGYTRRTSSRRRTR